VLVGDLAYSREEVEGGLVLYAIGVFSQKATTSPRADFKLA
jgi:hypothetical protein